MNPLVDTQPEQPKKGQPLNVQGPYSVKAETKHMRSLMDLIAKDLDIPVDSLVDFDLSFYDTTPPQLVGIHQEFTSSP